MRSPFALFTFQPKYTGAPVPAHLQSDNQVMEGLLREYSRTCCWELRLQRVAFERHWYPIQRNPNRAVRFAAYINSDYRISLWDAMMSIPLLLLPVDWPTNEYENIRLPGSTSVRCVFAELTQCSQQILCEQNRVA
jgi:hypothetical protein